MKKDIHVTIYTKEKGRLDFTKEEWLRYDWTNKLTYHRIDGPAWIWNKGSKEWWINGKRHRIDGPAIEQNGFKHMWYIDYVSYSKEKFNQIINEVKSLPLELRLTDPRWWVREMR